MTQVSVSGEPTRRGELTVYLGCAPGVGKTYEMLQQAHAEVADGRDVVVGVVESHGRSATAALVDGLEVIAPSSYFYRGTTLWEMDVGAVLARAPEVVLVDELAHTNAIGATNAKRWRDVADLRDAGIDVITTLNIQHLESLNDVVEQITGVKQQETVPDDVVRAADQIELVDIAPEALRQRLSAGKVYPADRVKGALGNYFRRGNLTALRELALLWLADRVDESLSAYREEHQITDTWETRERVVVAITGGPESATLLRRASRIASRSSAELVAVHVVSDDGLVGAGGTVGQLTDLATALRSQIHTITGDDTPTALLDFARSVNATQLVLGTSRRSRWQRLLSEGVGAAVVRESGSIDVHIVTHTESVARRNYLDIRKSRFRRPLSWAAALIVPAVATIAMGLVDRWLNVGSESAVFFAVILAVSLLGGWGPAALSALVSALLLNWFFTEPRHTFTVSEPANVVTIVVMCAVAIAVAVLVDSAAARRIAAARANRDAELLSTFSEAALRGDGIDELLSKVAETYAQDGISLIRRYESAVEVVSAVGERPPTSEKMADTVCPAPGDEFVLLLAGPTLGARDRQVLVAVAAQAAGIVTRTELARQASQAQAISETDRLRRSLLSAVSHDLRTPLAAIKASASSLRSTDVEFSPSDTAELLAGIEDSTDHLTAIVTNLLDSSRLVAGVVTAHPELVRIDDVVDRAVAGLSPQPGVSLSDAVRNDCRGVVAYADAGLLERALANLVDNALRHSGSDVVISARYVTGNGHRCRILVVDHGVGVSEPERASMFAAFARLGDRNAAAGVGLGLAVARGFTEAMGGTVHAAETAGGGLTMVIDLPSDGGA